MALNMTRMVFKEERLTFIPNMGHVLVYSVTYGHNTYYDGMISLSKEWMKPAIDNEEGWCKVLNRSDEKNPHHYLVQYTNQVKTVHEDLIKLVDSINFEREVLNSETIS